MPLRKAAESEKKQLCPSRQDRTLIAAGCEFAPLSRKADDDSAESARNIAPSSLTTRSAAGRAVQTDLIGDPVIARSDGSRPLQLRHRRR